MHYEEINKRNKDRMKGTIRSGPKMEWVDDEFMADLLGQVPKVKNTNDDRDVTAEIKHLKCLLSKYNFITTDRQSFINDISDVLQKIKEISPNWHGISLDRIIYFLDLQKFCLISGFGGIGKSYFIFQFEEQLEMCGIPHLCIYGKFEKSLDDIDFDSIRLVAKQSGFVFVIDALNEMDDTVQQDFLNRLETLSECRGLRIVVTYRTHRLAKEIVDALEKLSSYEYLFPGVSYESALDLIIRNEVPNAYKYEPLLYSNNALILQTLCAVLSENLVIDEEINGFSILTHILEAYFRKTLGIKHWNPTKQVVKWMYDNCTRDITENILFQIINNATEYIAAMKQYGFWEEVKWNGENHYSFTIETLSDYLFARYFIQEIQGKTEEEQVQIIKQKKSAVLGIDEVLIVALFDYSRDYELIYRLLQKTKLFYSFRIELPLYIRFDIQSISSFQKSFHLEDPINALLCIGGYDGKPFNCINYLNKYLTESVDRQEKDLSKALSGQTLPYRLAERLKNMIYFISASDITPSEEMLWFALWCTASANQRARCYAQKLLYEVLHKAPEYIDVIVSNWSNVFDPYIQDAVIHVLALCYNENMTEVKTLLSACITNPSFLLGKSLKRISVAFGSECGYIAYTKENLFQHHTEGEIPEKLNKLFWHLDFVEKYLLPFRYHSADHLDGLIKFITAPKDAVAKWNCQLSTDFRCVKNGDCKGSYSFEKWIFATHSPSFSQETLDSVSFLLSLANCIEKVMTQYGIDVYLQTPVGEREYYNSVYRKVIDIAIDMFYGSMMCNYYTESFSSYNNIHDSIGFDIYDPLEYDDQELFLSTPIATYDSAIEIIGDNALASIERFEEYDDAWAKNAELSISVLQGLLHPVTYKQQEWVVLNAVIHISGQGRREAYDIHCCTNPNVHLSGKYEDRYLSIEIPKYRGDIFQYSNCPDMPWACKDIPTINGSTDWFDNTNLSFPPAQIVHDLNLQYSVASMAWIADDNTIVIRCDNNKNSFYSSEICSAVFMRKDYFDAYTLMHPVHYFCYTEKMIEGQGFTDEASLHLEFCDGRLHKRFLNSEEHAARHSEDVPVCRKCTHGLNHTITKDEDADISARYYELISQYMKEDSDEEQL